MKLPNSHYRRKVFGFTLPEMTIAVGILSLIFSFMAFLTLITARNTYNLHQQFSSQESASKANQRLTFEMRNAFSFQKFAGDSGGGPFSRMKVCYPSTPDTYTTHSIAMRIIRDPADPTNNLKTRQEIRYYNRELLASEFTNETISVYEGRTLQTYSVPSVTATDFTYRFPLVTNFKLFYRSEYRVTLETSYRYSGFAFRFSHPEFQPEGRFITECIAKNHFMDQGVDNYGQSDNSTSSPASLY